MSNLFFDSSALVKRYLTEVGSIWVNRETRLENGNLIVVAEITRVEVAAAIAGRHRATGGITRDERDESVSLLLEHFNTEYQLAPFNSNVVGQAVGLTQQHRLRGYDAVQLATALIVNQRYIEAGFDPLTFVAAAADLLAAAAAEGLATENPNEHP